jgi:heme/copper-type cytochrome/quinol oxidase subunit 4
MFILLYINIRMDLREIRWEVMDWLHMSQDKDQRWALVNTIMNLRVA